MIVMMASDCEASCESDPNFAIICAFMEKFGEACGIENIDFVELQMMLEDNQEVSQKLIDLHIKLLRKIKKNVTPERWERALVNMCHIFSSKDAWEIERFGYKKTKLSIKIRALKELLEMQFDYNTKFKNEVNKMTAEELRSQPLGRDKLGRAYWFQTDNNYQIRIYKEDPDEETWKLIAKDREGLVTLISELTDGDSKLSSDSACNEDSNSLLDKPFIDTGQNESSNECKSKDEDKGFLGDQSSSDSKTNDCVKNSEIPSKPKEKETDSTPSNFTFKNKSSDEEPVDKKKFKLEISPEIESEMIIKGDGSGVENECGNVHRNHIERCQETLIIGEEIEEPVIYFHGVGSGVDCQMGNNKEGEKKKNESTAQTSHVGFKLGTIIDTKTENRILSPKDPNRKSRWDQKETQVLEKISESENVDTSQSPKKMTFFFGPGSLNVKPNTSMKPDIDDKLNVNNDQEKNEKECEIETKKEETLEDQKEVENNNIELNDSKEEIIEETKISSETGKKSEKLNEEIADFRSCETKLNTEPKDPCAQEESKKEIGNSKIENVLQENKEVPGVEDISPNPNSHGVDIEHKEEENLTDIPEVNAEKSRTSPDAEETTKTESFDEKPETESQTKSQDERIITENLDEKPVTEVLDEKSKTEKLDENSRTLVLEEMPKIESQDENKGAVVLNELPKTESLDEKSTTESLDENPEEKTGTIVLSRTPKTESPETEDLEKIPKSEIIDDKPKSKNLDEKSETENLNKKLKTEMKNENTETDENISVPTISSKIIDKPEKDKSEEEKTVVDVPDEKKEKPHASITNFTFDYDPNSPVSQPEIITRNLRKRGRDAVESKPDVGETIEKKPKIRGKRTIDVNLRKSVEEKRQQDVSSDDNDSIETTKDAKGKNSKKLPSKKQEHNVSVSDSDNASQKSDGKTKTKNKNKRILKNLGVKEEDISKIAETPVPVRQSRRLAQLKIQQEAIRRRIDEEELETSKTKKKKDDKDFKAGKRKRIEEEVKSAPTPPLIEKKKHKKKKKDKISIGWNTSSEDSDYTGKEEEEGSEYEFEDHNEDVLEFKSDHEFSPESDLEGDDQLPLKRARTARKEESDDDDVDEEFPCQKCGKSDHPEWILLCDNCDNGWHCSCLRPALFVIPEGDWYCPTCQHDTLLKKIQEKLHEFDKMLVKKEMEDRRKERLAYVGISLNNVLPAKEKKEKKKIMGSDKSSENDSVSESESKSETAESSSDSDEPIYQLRQRRQAHSYKFQDYDDLINSALQEEPTVPVEKTHTKGRGKDIATIVNAAKEEEEKNVFEDLPPVVPKDTNISTKKKSNSYRRKPKRLNNLEVNSDDEGDDSDEDFKGSSSNYSDEDDFDEDSDDSFIGKKNSKNSRRSTRARQKRIDYDFINDDSDDSDDIISTRKKRRAFIDDDSDSDLSDTWGKKKKKSSNKKKSKKKKMFDDSDTDFYKKKKSKKVNMDSDDNFRGRRTRGKKTSYVLDELGSDSEEEDTVIKKTKGKSDDDEEYVAEEEEEKELEDEEEEDVENEDESEENETQDSDEADSDSKDEPLPIIKKIKITKKPNCDDADSEKNLENEKPINVTENEKHTSENSASVIVPLSSLEESAKQIDNDDTKQSLNGNSKIDENISKESDEIPSFKSQQEISLKKVRTGGFFNKSLQSSTLITSVNDDNDELSEPPGVGLPLFTEFSSGSMQQNLPTVLPGNRLPSHLDPPNLMTMNNQIGYPTPTRSVQPLEAQSISPPSGDTSNNISPEGTPKKRRGRGKGKKTLAAEAAAAAASASTVVAPNSTEHKPLVPNIEIASPPQPFSQSQPTPSVITRMLQTAPCKPSYPVGRIRPKQFAMIADGEGVAESVDVQGEGTKKEVIPPPTGRFGAPVSGSYPAGYYPKDGQATHFQHPHPQQGPPIHNFPSHPIRPPTVEPTHISPAPISLSEPLGQYRGPPQSKYDPVAHRQTFPNPHTNYDYDYTPTPPPIINTDDGLPQPSYEQPYNENFENSDGSNSKNVEDEPGGEFGGLVSYFSSQREDDLDT